VTTIQVYSGVHVHTSLCFTICTASSRNCCSVAQLSLAMMSTLRRDALADAEVVETSEELQHATVTSAQPQTASVYSTYSEFLKFRATYCTATHTIWCNAIVTKPFSHRN